MNFYIMFEKTTFMNLCITYSIIKIRNLKKMENKEIFLITFLSICIGIIYSVICGIVFNYKDTAIPNIILYIIYAFIILNIIDEKETDTLRLIIFSIAMALASKFLAGIINFFILKLNIINNEIIEYITLGSIQLILICLFFKIKRFKNGFTFLNMKNKKFTIIGIMISITLIFFATLIGKDIENTVVNDACTLIIAFGAIAMFDWIKKSITKYYKEKMKERTVEIQQEQIKQQDEKIKNLQTELADVLQINHKYSHRISAMEKAVTKLGTKLQANEEFAEEYGDILSSIKKLSKEYKEEVASVIKETKLPKTNIFSIDNLLEYMKQESEKDKIDFELNLDFDISEILETKIPQSKLETMIADHIRDAIIAINCSENKDRRIKVVLDKEDNNYQIKFYDTGIEFEIETLSNLGLKRITTHKSAGGSGIGFMTTFETLKQCKASLIIEEYSDLEYTKAVIIKFDNKNEYRIHSYRAEKIKNKIQDNRIIIE